MIEDERGNGRRKHGRGLGCWGCLCPCETDLKLISFLDETLMGVYARPRRNPTKATIKVEVKVETRFLEVKLSFRCALPWNYPTNDGPSTETLKTYFLS
jgi:hypothetical protein